MSTTQYAETPVDELRQDYDHESGNGVLVSDWCEYHDLYMHLMPFEYRHADSVTILQRIKTALNELHDYAQTFKLKDVSLNDYAGTHMVTPLLRMFLVTKYGESSRGGVYNNPYYEHYDACIEPIKEYQARVTFYDEWKDVPTTSGDWFAKHFGISNTRFVNWVRESEFINRQQQRDKNKKRLARTFYTISEWTDYTQMDVKRLLPGTTEQYDRYIQRYVRNTDWQPPERPTGKPWFHGH